MGSAMKTPTLFLVAVLTFASTSFAVDPPPDGDYGNGNTAEGLDALFSLDVSNAYNNTALGFNTLYSHTSGSDNTACGFQALIFDSSGYGNAAFGSNALARNISGFLNAAVGFNSMFNNSTGSYNSGVGTGALAANSTGHYNTAIGFNSLALMSTGSKNTGLGANALFGETTGDYNVGVGFEAGMNATTGSYNIDISNRGQAGDSGAIRIGTAGRQQRTFIAGISGVTVASGGKGMVDTAGHLGTVTSSARYKDHVQPMAKSSEAILSLKPVTFCYKKELDPETIPQFGLVAEDVAKVDPDLVAKDDQGKPYTVRYEAVNAMLLNEFLKEHKKVEEQADQLSDQ